MTDVEERARFCRTVPTTALRVNLLGWSWTEDSPYPPWERLLLAPYWVEDKYVDVRKSFAERAIVPTLEVSDETGAGEVRVPRQSDGPQAGSEQHHDIVVYKAGEAIPRRAMDAGVAPVLVEVTPQTESGVFFFLLIVICHPRGCAGNVLFLLQ